MRKAGALVLPRFPPLTSSLPCIFSILRKTSTKSEHLKHRRCSGAPSRSRADYGRPTTIRKLRQPQRGLVLANAVVFTDSFVMPHFGSKGIISGTLEPGERLHL